MDHNDDKKNHFQGTRDELMLNQKKDGNSCKKEFFGSVETCNSFSIDMKFKMLVRMKEGTVPVPHAAPALSDDDLAPFGSYRIGGATAAGVKPP